jgi:hypothetical protein
MGLKLLKRKVERCNTLGTPRARRRALSGSAERHPIASPPPEPIGSAMSYEADIARGLPRASAVQKGPLPPAALERLAALHKGFAGEPR